ncbi:DinB family protein [Danxiaibacter flavus]|uniref:DinB family protein n=1 Tax=Danxiaibacter flavus TaxID=3049108 RepID=A0ABV3ZFW9_9BACT|nr:DinB family protein [Chitinophagaceae bacterium DXS]
METQKKNALEFFISLYDFHTSQYHHALENIPEEKTHDRLNTQANHVAYIAGRMVYEREALAKGIQVNIQLDTTKEFQGFKGIQDGVVYPSLEECRKAWDKVSPALKEGLQKLTEEQLNGKDPFEMPGGDFKLFDSIVFTIDHESYFLGQLGLYRRLLGIAAMKF